MQTLELAVSAASGLEAVVRRELVSLGVDKAPAHNGKLTFFGTLETVARCNLHLRTANRVFVVLSRFPAATFDELFEGVRNTDFSLLPDDAAVTVRAASQKSALFAHSALQSVTKRAVAEAFSRRGLGSLPETGPRFELEISLCEDVGTLLLNTSGAGLHRRGYRKLTGQAPLKETLAAALVALSVWNPSRPFADPFCGTGTLPVEAAMAACRMAPGKKRDFDFLHWPCFDRALFDRLVEEAEAGEVRPEAEIFGSDLDPGQLELAEVHAREAGVAPFVRFFRADARHFSSGLARGVAVSNPPYGERLSDEREALALMRDYARAAAQLPDWCFYLLSPLDLEGCWGRPADRRRKLYNGNLCCQFYSFLAPRPPSSGQNRR